MQINDRHLLCTNRGSNVRRWISQATGVVSQTGSSAGVVFFHLRRKIFLDSDARTSLGENNRRLLGKVEETNPAWRNGQVIWQLQQNTRKRVRVRMVPP